MSMYLNCNVIGRLGADPRSFTNPERAGCALRIAVKKAIRKDGKWVEETQWVSATLFGRPAETALKAFRKGDLVAVRGEPRVATFTAKDGRQVAALEVLGSEATRLASPQREAAAQNGASAPAQHQAYHAPEPPASAYSEADLAAEGAQYDDCP